MRRHRKNRAGLLAPSDVLDRAPTMKAPFMSRVWTITPGERTHPRLPGVSLATDAPVTSHVPGSVVMGNTGDLAARHACNHRPCLPQNRWQHLDSAPSGRADRTSHRERSSPSRPSHKIGAMDRCINDVTKPAERRASSSRFDQRRA